MSQGAEIMGHTPEGIAAIAASRTTWTSEQDALLAKLWREGKSATKIAEQSPGKTRNAVLGRVWRLRRNGLVLQERPREPPKVRAPRVRVVKVKPQGPPKSRNRFIRLVPNKPFMPPKRLPPIVDTLEGSVTLFELTGCKWPVTPGPPHRFCNRARCGEGPYCEGHAVRSVQPPKQRFLEAAE